MNALGAIRETVLADVLAHLQPLEAAVSAGPGVFAAVDVFGFTARKAEWVADRQAEWLQTRKVLESARPYLTDEDYLPLRERLRGVARQLGIREAEASTSGETAGQVYDTALEAARRAGLPVPEAQSGREAANRARAGSFFDKVGACVRDPRSCLPELSTGAKLALGLGITAAAAGVGYVGYLYVRPFLPRRPVRRGGRS